MSPSETEMTPTAGYHRPAWLVSSACVLLAGAFNSLAEPLDAWHARSSPLPDDAELRAVAFGNGRFVAVAYRDGHAVTSPDGTHWTLQNTGAGETSDRLSSLTFGNGVFVGVGPGGHIRTSPDGVQWAAQDADTSANFNNVDFVNGHFLATADGGWMLSSPNGLNWSPHNTASSNYWQSATFAHGQYVVVGEDALILQSDPVSATSGELRLTNPLRQDDDFQFQFASEIGQTYVVQETADLKTWTPVETIQATQNPMTWAEPAIPGADRFYRVVKP